ncbi:dmsr-2 [Pristionchus pacificus]|uniref:Dmsr-2 n=1 Tax=Pristionchus pacificus TaxID=54126 RepID=A0A2A6CD06_PRIPA|nr:dmsr-2 [Pristionchus pacificus]|eukprot:PDM75923.1 dmsr-2 [Pristionchus pacificus]
MTLECDSFNGTTSGDREYYHQWMYRIVSFSNFLKHHLLAPLCITGVLFNVLIVAVLLRPSMRSNAFNHFLILIAFCDATVMAMSLIFDSVGNCHPIFYTRGWIVFTKAFGITTVLIHSTSLWLTVNMAILRYSLLSRGSSASHSSSIFTLIFSLLPSPNTTAAALLSIISALVVAICGSLLNSIRYEIVDDGNLSDIHQECIGDYGWKEGDRIRNYGIRQPVWWNCTYERINYWIVAVVLKLLPCILLTIFMALLVNTLMEARRRRQRLTTSTVSSNTNAERTTAMLTVIVAVFLVTEMPQGIAALAQGAYPQLRYPVTSLNPLFNMLSLINSATNFLLCVLMSAVFRKECIHMFSNCFPFCFSSQSRSNQTTMLNMSSKNGFVPVPTGP